MSMFRVVKISNGEVQWSNPMGCDRDGLMAARNFIHGIGVGAKELGGFVFGDTQYDTYISIRDGKATQDSVDSGKMAVDAPVVSEFLIRSDDNDPYKGPFKFQVHDCGRAEFLRNGHLESEIA